MGRLIRAVKLNGLQFNANRDPQAYRRPVGDFRIQAELAGTGRARVTLCDAAGQALAQGEIALPGRFDATLRLDTPGTRVVTLEAAADGTAERADLRLDVLARDGH